MYFRVRPGFDHIHSGNKCVRSHTDYQVLCFDSAVVGGRSTKQTKSGFSNGGKAFDVRWPEKKMTDVHLLSVGSF